MQPVEFRYQNTTWATDQSPLLPLPSFVNDRETISCWRLTWRERLYVLITGRLWLRQCNYGEPLQPQCLQVASPFSVE